MWRELGRPEAEGRVWFAGEATQHSTLHRSTVRGAWHSGVRAAEGVVKEIGASLHPPVVITIPGADRFTPSADEAIAHAQKRKEAKRKSFCCIQ
jgi:hypothetical protein